ncbi:hypothetical protein [Acidovorax sp. CCYZU-2555]|nr:hypothetical protein [Acidovorax sp. CCYZU-2555]
MGRHLLQCVARGAQHHDFVLLAKRMAHRFKIGNVVNNEGQSALILLD